MLMCCFGKLSEQHNFSTFRGVCMKKNGKLILILIVGFLFLSFSCNYETYYKSITDLKEVRAKTSMESFENINDPIVITMPVYETMALFGNESMGTYKKRAGDIFVVYDWEKDRIHDWLFFEGNHGWSNFRAVEMGTPVKYYDSGDKIGCLDTSGKLITYKNTVMGTFTNLNNNQKTKSRYGLLHTDGYLDGKTEYRINIFDSQTEKVNDHQIKILSEYSYFHFPKADYKGNYWITSVKNNSNYLNKIDCEQNEIKDFDMKVPYKTKNGENTSIITMTVQGTVNNYIILSHYSTEKDRYSKIIVFDMDKGEKYCEIPLPVEDHLNGMYAGLPVNEKFYGIFPADYDDDESDWCDYIDIYEIDIENKETHLLSYEKFDFTETVYSRGSRIYFLNSRKLSKFVCTYFDTASRQWGKTFEISQEEILAGKKEATENNNL